MCCGEAKPLTWGHTSQGALNENPFDVVLDENSLVNYFYYVQTIDGDGDTAVSNEVGVFHFELVPGE